MKSTLLSEMERATKRGDDSALHALLNSAERDAAQGKRALKCLLLAIEKGHDALALDLLRWGVAVDGEQPSRRLTPLLACAIWNRADVARELIGRGADLEKRDRYGWTPLLEACCSRAMETAQVLAEAGADIEAINAGTPLCCAASRGHAELMRYLIALGAQVDPPLWSPLDSAIHAGHLEAVQVLVEARAMLKRPLGSAGASWNALDSARSRPQPNAEIIAFLEAASIHSPTPNQEP